MVTAFDLQHHGMVFKAAQSIACLAAKRVPMNSRSPIVEVTLKRKGTFRQEGKIPKRQHDGSCYNNHGPFPIAKLLQK